MHNPVRECREVMQDMTIKEVCEKYDLTPDTHRYYERVGVIPEVNRTKGGIRDYTEEDEKWVVNAVCMRGTENRYPSLGCRANIQTRLRRA